MRIYYFAFLIIFLSCIGTITSQISLHSKKELSYYAGIDSRSDASGIYCDNLSGEEFLFFTEFPGNYKTYIYKLNGELYKTIDISILKKRISRFRFAYLLSLDKILTLSSEGYCFIINDKGEIIQKFNSNEVLKQYQKENHYDYLSSCINEYNGKHYLYLTPYWFETDSLSHDDYYYPLAQTDCETYMKIRAEKIRNSPLCYEICIDDMTTKVIYKNYNKNIIKSNEYNSGFIPPIISAYKSSLYGVSHYKDSLWKIDIKTNTVKSYKIATKKLNLSHELYDMGNLNSKSNCAALSDSILDYFAKTAHINKIVYDPYRNYYYIMAKYPLDPHDNLMLTRGLEKKLLIVLDHQFKKITEIELEKGKYTAGLVLPCKEGVLISNSKNHVRSYDYDPENYHLELFVFDN